MELTGDFCNFAGEQQGWVHEAIYACISIDTPAQNITAKISLQ